MQGERRAGKSGRRLPIRETARLQPGGDVHGIASQLGFFWGERELSFLGIRR